MCVNDATVKNVACLVISSVISFPVLMSNTGLKAIRNLSQPIRIKYTRKYWPTKTLHLRLLTMAWCETGNLWKKHVHSPIAEGHSNLYLVEFVSANVVWFSSSWILNKMCNFIISNFQNNIFLDYKLLRYTAQASAITVFISGDENSSRKYILSEYVHVARWGWKTRISDNFTVLKWEDFFRNRGKVLCILPHNAIQTPIQPPSHPRLYDAWMATWLSRGFCIAWMKQIWFPIFRWICKGQFLL